MIEVDQVRQCKQLSSQGMSIRAISKEVGIARNTVRRYLRGIGEPGIYRLNEGRPQPVRDALRAAVHELLANEQMRLTPRKQRLTATRIHRLLAQRGIHASERTVRTVVVEVRMRLRDALEHAYLPLEYDPGIDAQVDFYEGFVDWRGRGRVKVHVLLVRACYSGRTFAYAAPNQTREALFEGLMRAFEHFGGVFPKLWFDNLTPAVRKVLKGRNRKLQRAFEAFQAHYGFTGEFCAKGKGNEKGGVENEVKFSRVEVLSPIPEVDSRDEVQALCDAWMDRELERSPARRSETIGELWAHEPPQLIELPPRRFDAATRRSAKVTPRSWVSVGTNFYSVPVEWVGHSVMLELQAEHVLLHGPEGSCARHRRCYGREQMVLEIDHYLPLLHRKVRGLDRAVPVRRFLEKADPCWPALLRALRQREGEIHGSRAWVDTLLLCREYGDKAVTEAVRRALGHEQVSLGLVRFYLWNHKEQEREEPVAIDYPGPQPRPASIAAYADLTTTAEGCHVR